MWTRVDLLQNPPTHCSHSGALCHNKQLEMMILQDFGGKKNEHFVLNRYCVNRTYVVVYVYHGGTWWRRCLQQHNDMRPGNRSTTCNISPVEVWRVTGSHIRTTFAYKHHVRLTRTIVRIYAPRALAKLHGNVAATSIEDYCTWKLHPEHGFSTSVVTSFLQHNKQIRAS